MPKSRFAVVAAAIVLASSLNVAEARADNYGAIAYSPDTGATGWSYDHPSRSRAQRIAMGNCRGYAYDCRIAIYFRNACGAVAQARDGAWGSGWGVNRRQAERDALDSCSNNGDGCRVVRRACTSH